MKIELLSIRRRLRTLTFVAVIVFFALPAGAALARGGHGGGHAAMGHGIGHGAVAHNGPSYGQVGRGSPIGPVGRGSFAQRNMGRNSVTHKAALSRGRGGRHFTTAGDHSGRRIGSARGAAGQPFARASAQHFSRNQSAHHHHRHDDHHVFFGFWPGFYDPFFYGYGSYYYYDPYPCDPSNDPDCTSYYTRHYYPYVRGPRPPYSYDPSHGPVRESEGQ